MSAQPEPWVGPDLDPPAPPTDSEQVLLERLERLRDLRVAEATGRKPIVLEPHQIPPPPPWYVWLLLGGRGSGKTQACAAYFDRFMRQNPGARGGIIAPTLGDASASCVEGPSGLAVLNPRIRTVSRRGGTFVLWPEGSEAKLFGAHSKEDAERLRSGGNRSLDWCEEVAAWRALAETWAMMEFGLRLGDWPHIVASTTPKPRPTLRQIVSDPETVLAHATMHDNPHLPEPQKARLIRKYAGTRLEAQEILGHLIDDVEGALWTYETLEQTRVDQHPDLARVVVAVDPSGGDAEGNDEQGIVVVGRGVDGHGYVLADASCKLTPDGWGRRAVQAYVDYSADRIVAETNFGGDLVIANVKVAARAMGVEVATRKITASRGKVARAEPVSALFEQGRAHLVGVHDDLEEQLREWTPDAGWSPDRLDAMVWGFTETMLGSMEAPAHASISVPSGSAAGLRVPSITERRSGWGGR